MAKKLTDVDITTVIDDAIKLFIQTKENDKDCVRKIDIVQFKNYIIETLNIPVATKTNNGLMSRDNVSTLESLDTQTANLITKIGTLDNLTTGQKTNLVNAINEIKSEFDSLKQSIGNTTSLSTTSKEIVGAVNELNSALNGHKIIKIKIDQTTDQYGQVFVAVGKGLTYVSTPIIIRYGDGITVDYVLTGMYYNTDTGSCSFKVRTPNGTTLTNSPVNFSCIVIGFS